MSESSEEKPGPKITLPSDEQMAIASEIEHTVLPTATFRPLLAVGGALVLGLLGAAIWGGFTVWTNYQLGLVAIVIGILAGKGAAMGGRGRPAQIVGAVSAGLCYFVGQGIVVVALSGGEAGGSLAMPPLVPLATALLQQTFTGIDVLFLVIAVWEGYVIPRAR